MNYIKPKQRVADHREVFTPAWMVEAMLDLVEDFHADQLKSLDWRARDPAFVCALPTTVTSEVLQKIGLLLAE